MPPPLPSWRLASTPCWRLVPTAGGGARGGLSPGDAHSSTCWRGGRKMLLSPAGLPWPRVEVFVSVFVSVSVLVPVSVSPSVSASAGQGGRGTRAGRRQGATGGSPDGTTPQSPVASPESDCQIAHLRLGGERGGRSTNPLLRDPPCKTKSVAAMSPSPSQEVPGYRIGTILVAVGTPESLLG